jgi:hypothetical protein
MPLFQACKLSVFLPPTSKIEQMIESQSRGCDKY